VIKYSYEGIYVFQIKSSGFMQPMGGLMMSRMQASNGSRPMLPSMLCKIIHSF